MELSFDIRGNLKPYERIELNVRDFKSTFVDSFDEDSARYHLFDKYLDYTENFKDKVTSNFTQLSCIGTIGLQRAEKTKGGRGIQKGMLSLNSKKKNR